MRRIIFMIICLSFLGKSLFSQNRIETVLAEIEKNNTSLSALRKSTEADKIGNNTGFFLQNPEVEFHYLWGTPSSIGDRTDIYITQSFDFPSVYGFKNQIAHGRNSQLDVEYQNQRNSVLFQVRLLLIDIIYSNAIDHLYQNRINHASMLADAYKNKLAAGEANILESNKAQLYLLNLQKEAETNRINRDALFSQLIRSNNGKPVAFHDTAFQYTDVPLEFEVWFEQTARHIPELSFIKNEIEISHKQEQLSRAQSLPKFSAGYMSEKTTNQEIRGITAGISIPLWENKNTVKFTKAKTIALQNIETDRKLQIASQLRIHHTKILRLQKTITEYRSSLRLYDNTKLLDKALEKGEITLIEYILEVSIYYTSLNNLLETEKELNKAIAEMYKFIW